MSKIFFTGCTHFGHANIINLANRPFKDVTEMGDTLVENWNARVDPTDHVWVLGDFAFKGSEGAERFNQLNGHKHLIIGNHDHEDTLRLKWASKQHYKELKVNNTKLILFHYPILEWNGAFRNVLHLHAHTHKKLPLMGTDQHADNRINVTVEAWNYAPMEMETLLKWHEQA